MSLIINELPVIGDFNVGYRQTFCGFRSDVKEVGTHCLNTCPSKIHMLTYADMRTHECTHECTHPHEHLKHGNLVQ